MKKKNRNSVLHRANSAKNDEFYTLIQDIEKEMSYYHDHFKGKTIYLNCDDPRESKFFHFFSHNFESLGLKKLISTGYKANGHGVKYVYTGGSIPDPEEIEIVYLKGTGGFETEECIELLKEADIVVSNPPFSLFRKYIAQLVEYDKKFVIVGNKNVIFCADIFPLFKANKLWLGVTRPKEFMTPDGKLTKKISGLCRWFTNLEHYQHNEELNITKEYNEKDYPKYDNYDAINVDRVKDIPIYDGIMGVPITFIDKYNPGQFEILGCSTKSSHGDVPNLKKYDEYIELRQDGTKVGRTGQRNNGNAIIPGNDRGGNFYLNEKTGHIVQSLYIRIFIRRRQSEDN